MGVVLASLLAMFLNAFVVQTHIHLPTFGHAAITADVNGHHEHLTAEHDQISCLICEALAASGGATLPSAATVAPTPIATHAHAAPALPRGPPALSHAWQSRAPPIAL